MTHESDGSTSMPKREHSRPIPTFESEDDEREFWAARDSTDFLSWREARTATFPALKPSTRTISCTSRSPCSPA